MLAKLEDDQQKETLKPRKAADLPILSGLFQRNMKTQDLMFVGEAGIHLWTRQSGGKATWMSRAICVVHDGLGPNITVTFCSQLQLGAHLSRIFGTRNDDETCLIFANAPAHSKLLIPTCQITPPLTSSSLLPKSQYL